MVMQKICDIIYNCVSYLMVIFLLQISDINVS